MAFAITAPVAPATARPHGGIGASFDCPAIVREVQKSNRCLGQGECSRRRGKIQRVLIPTTKGARRGTADAGRRLGTILHGRCFNHGIGDRLKEDNNSK